MPNRTWRGGLSLVGTVVTGLLTAGVIAAIGIGSRYVHSRRELHVEAVLRQRQNTVGVLFSTSGGAVELLAPFCATPNVVVAGTNRYRTHVIVCVIVVRYWNRTRHSVDVTTTAVRLRFRASTYADVTTLRVAPPTIPPGCSALLAFVFEIRPDERGTSALIWKFVPRPSQPARVDQPIGPIRTSGPLLGLPPDAAPATWCPER